MTKGTLRMEEEINQSSTEEQPTSPTDMHTTNIPTKTPTNSKTPMSKNTKIALSVLAILVVVLVGHIICDKLILNSNHDASNTAANTTDTTEINNIDEEIRAVSKQDESKDWVYDANYEKPVAADSYDTAFNTYYAKDIVVPYINIKSDDAEKMNRDIKKIFDSAIETYNKGVSDQITYVKQCNYESYLNDDILSIVITYGAGGTDVVRPEYSTYNVDLNTGKALSYEEVYKAAGFEPSNIDTNVHKAITHTMEEKLSSIVSSDSDFNHYNNLSIENYNSSIANNSIRYFLSDSAKLNIVVKLNIPAGAQEFNTIITIE